MVKDPVSDCVGLRAFDIRLFGSSVVLQVVSAYAAHYMVWCSKINKYDNYDTLTIGAVC